MKKVVLASALLLCSYLMVAQQNPWRRVNEASVNKNLFANRIKPQAYQLFQLDEPTMRTLLQQAPSEKSVQATASDFTISIPDANGLAITFRAVNAPVMDPALAAKFPGIYSFAGVSTSDPSTTIRFSISPLGFHGMILSAKQPTIYIDPLEDNYYMVVSRADVANYRQPFACLTDPTTPQPSIVDQLPSLRNADDGRLRTYRLALCASGEFSQYWLDGTETTDAQRKAKVLAAMNNQITRVNGIYERDFGVRVVLVANNDLVIYLNAGSDPFTSSGSWNSQAQSTCDGQIGGANYDIGHLVTRAANNGNAGCIGCVCTNGSKGSGWTAYQDLASDFFVVDYLTHEMGHQFGGNHTFTHSNEGTIAQAEPGSGSTIMGYAGITGATTDVQPHSDDYFHARSIEQITNYIKSRTCQVTTITGNATPTANAGVDYVIPRSTPFTLTGSGTDADAGDVLTYIWEQIDQRATGFSTVPSATATAGPQFRSRIHNGSTSRTFPILASILDGTNTNKWEVLPSVARTLNFRFTVRDNHAGGGNNKSDDMVLTINGTAGPFAVTAPNTALTWTVGSSQTVTWSVNSTNVAPVNCANVNIRLSTDGGLTFPIVLASNTPNDGSQSITVPANPGTTCRVKVEAVGNIFFDISNTNFTISGTPPACSTPTGLISSSVTQNSATISWSSVSGGSSYDVDYKTNASSTWTNAATGTTSLSANLSSLVASTLYDWRVRANCSSGSSSYATAQFTTQAPPSGCLNAHEANETLATAATVSTNTAISAAIGSSTDIDWYRVTTSATSNFNITLTNLPGDYDLFFYNSAGTQIGSSEAGGTSNESIVLNNQAAGTYYVRVIGYNGVFSTTVCYNLNIGATTVTGCQSSYDVSTNGTAGGAALIPFNTDITGLISPSGDNDYYRFVITTGGTATITLTTLPADYDIRLYSSDGTTQLAISQNGSTTSETITRTYTAGTYYVRVYGYNNANNATSCYTLRVALGTASKEEYLITGTKLGLFPNPASNDITVTMDDVKGMADIRVFDIYGKMVMQQTTNRNNTRLHVADLPSGVYMVKVINDKKESTIKFVKQ